MTTVSAASSSGSVSATPAKSTAGMPAKSATLSQFRHPYESQGLPSEPQGPQGRLSSEVAKPAPDRNPQSADEFRRSDGVRPRQTCGPEARANSNRVARKPSWSAGVGHR